MLSFAIALDLTGLPARIETLRSALNISMAEGLDRASELVAAEARANHPYQNRTGDLEESTQSTGAVGTFLAGNLESGVIAPMPYGSIVDENPDFAFLQPAFERSEAGGYAIVQDALDTACARAWP